jgi:integrase
LLGRRQQARRRYATEREARTALGEIIDTTAKGQFISRSTLTVEQMCSDYLSSRHKLRASSKAKLEYDLAPLRERYGQVPVQRLTKGQIDSLVRDLTTGGTRTAKGRQRKPWSAESVNKVVASIQQVLSDVKAQGIVGRNVAELVNGVTKPHKDVDTYTEAEVHKLLAAIADDRLAHAWELALSGLRRGEIAGLRWADVALAAKTLSITNNRVSAGGKTTENDPKSAMSRRTLPLPERLVSVLKAAKARQAAERLALGRDGSAWSYAVSN